MVPVRKKAVVPFPRRVAGLCRRYAARYFDRGARLNRLYDKCTMRIMSNVLDRGSHCVDVGCHTGQVLEHMLAEAPDGTHYAFEPLPELAAGLRERFPGVNVFEVALSDVEGTAEFRHVVSRPAYSGLREREYPSDEEETTVIEVQTRRLDDLLPAGARIDFIKVDVEGAELQVFRGAVKTIASNKPYIVFEHGLGAADYYGTRPESVYDLLVDQCGLKVSLLPEWLKRRPPLSREGFVAQFDGHANFYFLAHP